MELVADGRHIRFICARERLLSRGIDKIPLALPVLHQEVGQVVLCAVVWCARDAVCVERVGYFANQAIKRASSLRVGDGRCVLRLQICLNLVDVCFCCGGISRSQVFQQGGQVVAQAGRQGRFSLRLRIGVGPTKVTLWS
jgi:hypothetical protein